MEQLHPHLDTLYSRWTRPEYIAPDPLQFLAAYDAPNDREIAGLVASSLAFGNVKQIVRSINAVLDAMPRPAQWLDGATDRKVRATFDGFRHRYVTGAELSAMLNGARRIRQQHGSLGAGFFACLNNDDTDVHDALCRFVAKINGGARKNYLVPDPSLGSACKRLHLYLRWMVRKDAVDPGGWDFVPKHLLLMPVDTHIHRIATRLGITTRKSPDLHMSREITAAFKTIAPDDPVRYDFALTRLGIRDDADDDEFMSLMAVRI